MPVFGSDGVVLAVVLAINKRDRAGSGGAGAPGAAFFAADDERRLLSICTHIAVALQNNKDGEKSDQMGLGETIKMMRMHQELTPEQTVRAKRANTARGAAALGAAGERPPSAPAGRDGEREAASSALAVSLMVAAKEGTALRARAASRTRGAARRDARRLSHPLPRISQGKCNAAARSSRPAPT